VPLARWRAAVAIRFRSRDITYGELDEQAQRLAAGFLRRGVQPGDRVALFLPNCPEAVAATLACYEIGAIAVPLNYRFLAREASYVLDVTAPALLIFHTDRASVVESLAGDTAGTMDTVAVGEVTGRHTTVDALYEAVPLRTDVELAEEDPALILFTSGSTGRPKGVMHSHHSAFSGIDISRRITEVQHGDVVLVGKPISHAGGLETQLMPALSVGGRIVLAMKPTPAEAAVLISTHSVTQYALMASDLLDFVEYLEQTPTDLHTLQNCLGSGDTVATELHHRFRDIFGWEVMEGCGMTELGTYYAMNPRHGRRKWGSLGEPCPDTHIRIIDAAGREAGPGETGEIMVRSPAATIGYWNDAAATATLFRDGWLLTGDLGRRDDDGYLWFVGRKKLIIVRRGSNIAPAEVENVIDEHPLVHASVVVGVPDEQDGHVPIALVAALDESTPPDEQELASFVAARLAAYKTPVRYVFLRELPCTGTGKFDRHRLEELASEAVATRGGRPSRS
jgi:long-chain acyl-CoA synthetase